MKYRIDKHQLLYKLGQIGKDISDLCTYMEIDMQSMYRRFNGGFTKAEILLVIVFIENVVLQKTDLQTTPELEF